MSTNTRNANTGSPRFHSDFLKIKLDGDRIPSEHEEQRAFIEVWRKAGLPPIFAIPNGGKRSATAAAKLKLEGVTKGVPDLYCPELALWIEFKRRKGGGLSKEQRQWRQHLEELGHRVIVPRGAHQAIEMVKEFYGE